jgi:hypothetical protein
MKKLKQKLRAIFVRIDSATIDRKQCLPAFITWRDICLKGILAAEAEQKKTTNNLNKKEEEKCQ